METRNKRKRSRRVGNNHPKFFIYTNETQQDEIQQETLTHLRVDSSVREIPAKAFKDCNALVHVQLPETLTRINERAFYECYELKFVQFVSNASLSKTSSSSPNPNPEDGLLVIPERANVKIGQEAFASCTSIQKVIVCSSSATFAKGAFSYCFGLTSVELAAGLQVIEQALFCGCESLAMVKIPSSVIKICESAFYGCRSLTSSSFDLPHGLLELGAGSFEDCSSIEALYIPATVSLIGKSAFRNCSVLKNLKLPPTLERIESRLCHGCEKLEHIEIPTTVKRIDGLAFSRCSSISHVRIPPSVDHIERDAFIGCNRLISFELPEGIVFDIDLSGSLSLVNVAGPILTDGESYSTDFLQNSKFGRVVDDEADLLRKLKHRFDNSPLNKLCYYQSYHSSEDSMVQLRSLMEDDLLAATTQVDEFGMTPLHILSLSQTPNLDMLLTVMKGGLLDHIINSKDSFGSAPMDYLCLNRMPNSTEVIRRMLLKRFDEVLGFDRPWKSDMLKAIDEALAVDWSSRRREVVVVYLKLATYERRECLSLVELCLWKIKIDDVNSNENIADRQECRINSGASIVIPHVLTFLDKLDIQDH
eukprot:scaffold3955_cov160-Cylindrotheca_fusiformis.AAC.19